MSKYTCTGKVSDICPNCKNCKVVVWDGVSDIECEDPFDGMVKTLTADSNVCCSMFEMRSDKSCDKISLLQHELEMDKLRKKIHQLEKEKAAHMKGIERLKKSQEKLQNQVKNLQITNEESYKREEELEDKVHKLERRFLEERKGFDRLDTEFLTPLVHVLYPGEKVCKRYSDMLEDIKRLIDKNETLEQRYDNIHYTLYKDWSDDSISCPRDIPSEVKIIEDLKKRAAESDYYKEKSEVLNKRNSNQSVMIGEKGKEIERLAKKNREFQIRVNDLIFQHQEDTKKIVELKDDKYRILKEYESFRYGYPFYAAKKAEDKIEHIQKEAKRWKDKYKEAYDILQEFFGEHSNISSVSYDLSGDYLTLKLTYNVSINRTKYKNLENARERMKKLD